MTTNSNTTLWPCVVWLMWDWMNLICGDNRSEQVLSIKNNIYPSPKHYCSLGTQPGTRSPRIKVWTRGPNPIWRSWTMQPWMEQSPDKGSSALLYHVLVPGTTGHPQRSPVRVLAGNQLLWWHERDQTLLADLVFCIFTLQNCVFLSLLSGHISCTASPETHNKQMRYVGSVKVLHAQLKGGFCFCFFLSWQVNYDRGRIISLGFKNKSACCKTILESNVSAIVKWVPVVMVAKKTWDK